MLRAYDQASTCNLSPLLPGLAWSGSQGPCSDYGVDSVSTRLLPAKDKTHSLVLCRGERLELNLQGLRAGGDLLTDIYGKCKLPSGVVSSPEVYNSRLRNRQ